MSCGCGGTSCGCESFAQDIINGQDGAPGADGLSAYQLAVQQGYVGTLDQWIASLEGQSAYELAVSLGFSGTQAEWTASLQGTDGADGAPGNNSWTVTTQDFTMPVVGSQTAVNVQNGNFQALGSRIFVAGAGYFRQFGSNVGMPVTLVVLKNEATSYSGQAAPGTIIPAGSLVETAGEDGATGATGADGAAGAAGTDGTTPTLRSGTGAPSNGLGVNGDQYIQQVNTGKLQWLNKVAGFYQSLVTGVITASRMMYTSTTTDPNAAGITSGLNINDYAFTYIGTIFSLWTWTGSTWVALFSVDLASGGGGGVGIFQQVSDASPVLGPGRNLGTNVVTTATSIQYLAKAQNITSLLTTTLATSSAYHEVSIQVVSFTIDYITPTAGYNRNWIIRFTNDTAATSTITWSAGRWSKNAGITQPTALLPGEVVAVHCNYHDGHMNITLVEQGVTIIT